MTSLRNLSGVVLLACALVSTASAQGQNRVEADLNIPGEEHKKLDLLAGEWEVTLKIPTGLGRQVEGRASCVAKWVLDGRFLRQEYSSTFAGKPLSIVRYLGFDRHRSKFVEIQFETTHTDVMHNLGTISNDGRTITSFGEHTDRGTEVKVRTVTRFIDNDTFELQLEYSDLTGTRTDYPKTITLLHKRKPGA